MGFGLLYIVFDSAILVLPLVTYSASFLVILAECMFYLIMFKRLWKRKKHHASAWDYFLKPRNSQKFADLFLIHLQDSLFSINSRIIFPWLIDLFGPSIPESIFMIQIVVTLFF